MVVVATPNYARTSVPLVVRVKDAAGDRFFVRVDRADGLTGVVSGINVHYMVVEEGVYTAEEHGVQMEAHKYTSTRTDRKGSWVGQSQSTSNWYSSPVVVGQVMTYNDPSWSVFWSRSGWSKNEPPDGSMNLGKHVGEDPDTTRASETIGYIVIEAGSGSVSGRAYVAGVGANSIQGMGNAPPYSYAIGGLSSVGTAIVSQTAMKGGDGGWAVLYGSNPVSTTTLRLAIEEDRMADSERSHAAEQVAYLVFAADAGGAWWQDPNRLLPAPEGAPAEFADPDAPTESVPAEAAPGSSVPGTTSGTLVAAATTVPFQPPGSVGDTTGRALLPALASFVTAPPRTALGSVAAPDGVRSRLALPANPGTSLPTAAFVGQPGSAAGTSSSGPAAVAGDGDTLTAVEPDGSAQAEMVLPVAGPEAVPDAPEVPPPGDGPAAALPPQFADAYFAAVAALAAPASSRPFTHSLVEGVRSTPEFAFALAAMAVVLGGYPPARDREREPRCRLRL
jgi:hypothetical protein